MKWFCMITMVCLITLLTTTAWATTYWVSKTGSDSNTCVQAQTVGTAKLTISAGITCITAANGDVLNIKAGTYTDLKSVFDGGPTLPNGTSWANAATIRANTGETVILQSTSGWPMLNFYNNSYLILEDLIADGTNLTGTANPVSTTASSDHIRFNRVTARNSLVTGFAISGHFIECTDCVAHHNGTHGSLDHGFYLSGANNSADNTCLRCVAYNNSGYGYNQSSGSGGLGPTRLVCDQCSLHDNGTGGGNMGDSQSGVQRGNVIKNTISYNNGIYGFRLPDTHGGDSLLNVTAYGNGTGIAVTGDTINVNIKNSLSVGNTGTNYTDTGLGGTTLVTNRTTGIATDIFIDPATNNFRLKAGSAAIDAGTNINFAFCGSAPDQGAIEFCTGTELWSDVLSTYRGIDWSQAGIPGGIPNRTTQCGATINAYSGSTAAINTAITACPAGQFVNLGAGTFTMTSGNIVMKSNITLRGQGANNTNLVWAGALADNCFEPGTEAVCFGGSFNYYQSPQNIVDWTAGYAKGATVITIGSTVTGPGDHGMAVGDVLILDQLVDTVDTGSVVISDIAPFISSAGSPAACRGPTGVAATRRCQQEYHEVTAINGVNITITPPIQMPNWSASKSPQAWWANTIITLAGVENLSVNTNTQNNLFNFAVFNAHKCWLKGVRSIMSFISVGAIGRAHVQGLTASNFVVRDSYFYGTRRQGTTSYGIETFNAGNWLVENNIFEHIVSPLLPGTGAGNVYGYNYSTDHLCTDTATACSANFNMPGPLWGHDAGSTFVLQEGNQGTGTVIDALHGSSGFDTFFRNQWQGRDTGAGKTVHTAIVELNIYQRYHNLIGNVMGEAGYHNKYDALAPDTVNCATSIYTLGFDKQACGGSPTDARVVATMMRWGNYDTFNNAIRFVSTEVPWGEAFYPNAIPASQTLQPSFYLSTRPSWWVTPWGTSPWPPVGPDVTGGNVTSGSGGASTLGGHAYKIPARLCYENTPKTGGILNYDAAACYLITADTTPPTAPSALAAVASSSTQVNLSWTASTDNIGVTAYLVERCQGVGCSGFVQIASTAGLSIIDTGLSASTTYSYRVRATDAATNLSGYSNTASATTPIADTTPPTVPTNLIATPISKTEIDLTWTASTDNVAVSGYQVFRCTGAVCTPGTQIGTPAANAFNDTSGTCGTTYTYGVKAADTSNNLSALSATVVSTTLACLAPPLPPTGVTLQAVSDYSRDTGSWSWTQGAGDSAVGFHIKCGKATTQRTLLVDVPSVTTTALFIRQFLPGQGLWFCTVTAYNGGGDSTEATEVSTNVIGPGFGAWGFSY